MESPSDLLADEPAWLFPFEGMNVGDSFFIPTLRPAIMSKIVYDRARSVGIRVKVYACTRDNRLGIRVWRIR